MPVGMEGILHRWANEFNSSAQVLMLMIGSIFAFVFGLIFTLS